MCLARHARAPARLACRIVALAAVKWALAARQPGPIAGAVAHLDGRVVACLVTLSSLMPLSLSHDTLKCIVTCLMPFLATIQHVYCDTLLPSSHCPSCYVTIQFLCIKTQSLSPLAFLLQYSPAFISAIQTTVLQHKNPYTSLLNSLSCNTKFFFAI